MHRTTKINITDLNAHLVCYLCEGYYIDATTIIECLHSFCKTCIVRYLQTNKYCPVCEVQVHKTRPLLNIRADKTLQDIVYKLVPGLFKAEMKRRRQFYAEHPQVDTSSSLNSHEDRGEVEDHRFFYTAEESISLSLEYAENGRIPSTESTSETVVDEVNDDESSPRKRFLRCPAAVTVAHLKKLIRMKYSLSDEFLIDVFYNNDCLCDDYTLMDIAYIFAWRRNGPMRFMYRILKRKPRSVKRLKTCHEPPISAPPLIEITSDEKVKQDLTSSSLTSAPASNVNTPPILHLQNGHDEDDEGKATAAKSAPEPRPTPPPPPLTNGLAEADAAETPALEASEPEPARAQPSPVDPPPQPPPSSSSSEASNTQRNSSDAPPADKKDSPSPSKPSSSSPPHAANRKNEVQSSRSKEKEPDAKKSRGNDENSTPSSCDEKKKAPDASSPEDEPRRDDFGALDLSKSSSRHPSRSSSTSSRSSPAIPNDTPTPPPPPAPSSGLSPPRLPPTPSPPAPAAAAVPPSPVLPRQPAPPPPPPPQHTQPLQVRVRAPVSTPPPPPHSASVTPSSRGLPAVVPPRPVAPLRLQQANLSGTRLIPAGHRSTQTPTSGARLNQVISGLRGSQQQQQQKQQQQQIQQQQLPSTASASTGVAQNRPRLTLTIPRPFVRHLNFAGNQRGSCHHHHHPPTTTSSTTPTPSSSATPSSSTTPSPPTSHHHHHHHHHHHSQHPPHIPISRGLPSRPQHTQPVAKKSASDHVVCHRSESTSSNPSNTTSKHPLQNGEKTSEVAQAN